MTQRRMRVAVVGATGSTEHWADNSHIPAVQAVEEAELVAVCTSREESTKRAQARYGTRFAFSDYRELMRCDEVDLITVGVRVPAHAPVTIEALQNGKHVLCEWPLAVDVVQAQSLAKLAHERGLGHAVDAQAYWSPGIMFGKELMDQGYVGRPTQFHVTHFTQSAIESRPSHREWQSHMESGGAISIGTGHALAVVRWYLGEVAAVCGETRTLVPEARFSDTGATIKVTSNDTLMCCAHMASGAIGTVHVSSAAIGGGFRLAIYGTEGRLVFETGNMVQYSPAKVYGAKGSASLSELPVPEKFTQVHKLSADSRALQVAQLLRAFILSIEGKTPFHPNFDDAIRLHQVVAAVRRSTSSRSWETV